MLRNGLLSLIVLMSGLLVAPVFGEEKPAVPAKTEATGKKDGAPAAQPGQAQPAQAQQAPPPNPFMPTTWDGPILDRPKLTGNWGGFRDQMLKKGIMLDVDLTTSVQGIATGGLNSNSLLRQSVGKREDSTEVTGLGEIRLTVDTKQAGMWDNGIIRVGARGRFGETVSFRTGSVAPSYFNSVLPLDEIDQEIFDVSEITYTHFILPNKFAVFGGLLDTINGDLNPFAGSTRGKAQFFHTNFEISPILLASVPVRTLGGGMVGLPLPNLMLTTTLMNSQETAQHDPFVRSDGVTSCTEIYYQHKGIGGLPAGHMFGFTMAWREKVDLDQSLRGIVVSKISDRLGIQLPYEEGTKDSTWAANYNFFHYAQVFKGGPPAWSPMMPTLRPKGWGFFARASFSDGNPNPIKWFASAGFGGDNPIRLKDSWGVGAYYQGMSDDRLIRDLDIHDEKGIEAWYNWGVTGWMNLTADVQYINSGLPRSKEAVVLGLRLRVDF